MYKSKLFNNESNPLLGITTLISLGTWELISITKDIGLFFPLTTQGFSAQILEANTLREHPAFRQRLRLQRPM